MAAIAMNEDIPYETRFNLALQAIQLSQVPDIRAAAALYNIPRIKLRIKNTSMQRVCSQCKLPRHMLQESFN